MRTLQDGRGVGDPHRSAHPEPRCDLCRLLRSSRRDDVGGRGAGAAHRRAGRSALRAAARPRTLPDDLRAPDRAAARGSRRSDPRVHAAVHRCSRDVRAPPSGALAVDAPALARRGRGRRARNGLFPAGARGGDADYAGRESTRRNARRARCRENRRNARMRNAWTLQEACQVPECGLRCPLRQFERRAN